MRKRTTQWDKPIKISENYNMDILMRNQLKVQQDVYRLVMPHINDINIDSFKMAVEQKVTARPMWSMTGKRSWQRK